MLNVRALLVATLALVAIVWLVHRADAHSFYDYSCCSDRDCKPIAFDAVTAGPDGYHVRVPGARTVQVVPYSDRRIKPTPAEDVEQRYHVCTVGGMPDGHILCLYVPQGGV